MFRPGTESEETERRTLEFLLATDLRPREIVLLRLPHSVLVEELPDLPGAGTSPLRG